MKNSFTAALVALISFPLEHAILQAGQTASLVAAAVLIVAIVLACMRVPHHAEILAEKVDEPYGTMILTQGSEHPLAHL